MELQSDGLEGLGDPCPDEIARGEGPTGEFSMQGTQGGTKAQGSSLRHAEGKG